MWSFTLQSWPWPWTIYTVWGSSTGTSNLKSTISWRLLFCIHLFVFTKWFPKQILMLIFPNSILLDEEGHIKITGQCIQLQTVFFLCLFIFCSSVHLLLNVNLSPVSLFQILDWVRRPSTMIKEHIPSVEQ